MRTIQLLIITLFICLIGAVKLEAKSWNGITPLHSTRTEVEKVLGSPEPDNSCRCTYSYKGDHIIVQYADDTGCGSASNNEWSVPKDTVLSITIYPQKEPRLSALNLKMNDFRFLGSDDSMAKYYVDVTAGLSITVYGDRVHKFEYLPSIADESLRCKEYKPPVAYNYSPSLTSDEKELLDKFMARLSEDSSLKGMIFVEGEGFPPDKPTLIQDVNRYLKTRYEKDFPRVLIIQGYFLKGRLNLSIWNGKDLIPFP